MNTLPTFKFGALALVATLMLAPLTVAFAGAECPEGRTAVTMTNEQSGKTRVLCLPDQALPGIENAADNSSVEITAACPCWTAEELVLYDKKDPFTCVASTVKGDAGTECYYINDPTAEALITYSSDLGSSCKNDFEQQGTNISGLEFQECDTLLADYYQCPCWTDDDLAKADSQYGLACTDNSMLDGVDCYIPNTNKLLFAIVSKEETNACLNQWEGTDIKLSISDRQYLGCRYSLTPYWEVLTP